MIGLFFSFYCIGTVGFHYQKRSRVILPKTNGCSAGNNLKMAEVATPALKKNRMNNQHILDLNMVNKEAKALLNHYILQINKLCVSDNLVCC